MLALFGGSLAPGRAGYKPAPTIAGVSSCHGLMVDMGHPSWQGGSVSGFKDGARRRASIPFAPIPAIISAPGGRNSVVECLLPKQKVVGSNPIARSNTFLKDTQGRRLGLSCCILRLSFGADDNPCPSGYHCRQYPKQAVPKSTPLKAGWVNWI